MSANHITIAGMALRKRLNPSFSRWQEKKHIVKSFIEFVQRWLMDSVTEQKVQKTLSHRCPLFSHAVENIIMHHHTNTVAEHTRTPKHTHTLLCYLPPPFHSAVWLLADSVPDAAAVWLRLICHCSAHWGRRIDDLLISSSCGTDEWTGWV